MCGWRDSNPHAEAPDPKSGVSTNFTTPAPFEGRKGTRFFSPVNLCVALMKREVFGGVIGEVLSSCGEQHRAPSWHGRWQGEGCGGRKRIRGGPTQVVKCVAPNMWGCLGTRFQLEFGEGACPHLSKSGPWACSTKAGLLGRNRRSFQAVAFKPAVKRGSRARFRRGWFGGRRSKCARACSAPRWRERINALGDSSDCKPSQRQDKAKRGGAKTPIRM